MRLHSLLIVGSSILVVAGCRDRTPDSSALSNDLKRDLAAAASTDRLQLANSAGDYQRARFVSEIEQTNRSTPSREVTRPRPVVRKTTGQTPEATHSPTEEVANQVVANESPDPQPAAQAPASDEPRIPIVAPRPVAAPVEAQGPAVGGGGGRGAGAPPDIGEVIGVIMRGGRVDDDHCVPRRRGGGRGFPFPRVLQSRTGLRPIPPLSR
ncbi:MAG: hypothetical protein ABI877_14815 [Gemmatimonadaceae bacterium]